MHTNITQEDIVQIKERLSSKQTMYYLKYLEELKKRTIIFGLLIIGAILTCSIVFCAIGNFIVGPMLLLPILIFIPFFIYNIRICNKSLNEFANKISDGKLTYKEFKILTSLNKFTQGD